MPRRVFVLLSGLLLGFGFSQAYAQAGPGAHRGQPAPAAREGAGRHWSDWRLCESGPGDDSRAGSGFMPVVPWAVDRRELPESSPYDRAERVAAQRPESSAGSLPDRPNVLERPWTDNPDSPYYRAQLVAAERLEPVDDWTPAPGTSVYPGRFHASVPSPFRPAPSTSWHWSESSMTGNAWGAWPFAASRAGVPCAPTTWVSPGAGRGRFGARSR